MESADQKNKEKMNDSDIKVREMTPNSKKRYWQMLPRTVCHGLVIFTLGMALSMRGPTFLDLQQISGTDVERGSLYFTASAFGYIVGAFFTGLIYARVKAKDMLVIGPMIISAIVFMATPWCSHFLLMLAVHAVVAFFSALQETTVNTEEVKRWEGNSYPAMQFLSFSYSLGGIIGPLIVEPFLSPKTSVDTSNLTMNHHPTYYHHNLSAAYLSYSPQNETSISLTSADTLLGHNLRNESLEEPDYNVELWLNFSRQHNSSFDNHLNQTVLLPESNIHYAFIIAGAIIILLASPLCVLYVRTYKSLKKQALKNEENDKPQKRLPLKMYCVLTGMVCMFYLFYTTVDDQYSMYLSTFLVSYLDWSKEDGAMVSSLYWGCSTATKLVNVVLVRHVNPSTILFCSCLGMVTFLSLLAVCAYFHVDFMIWVCTAFIALSQSAIFGGGFAWADSNLLKVDGRVTSCTMISSSLGAMLAPMILGSMMKELSPMAFPYFLTFQAFITFTIFLVMLLVFKPYVSRTYGPPRPDTAEEKEVEESGALCHEKL